MRAATSVKPCSTASSANAWARSADELPAATRVAPAVLAGSWERKRRAMLPGPRTAQPGVSWAAAVGVPAVVAVCADMRILFVS